MQQIHVGEGRACGKFILIGEHFVVDGLPALAFPLNDFYCDVKISKSDDLKFITKIPNASNTDLVHSFMAQALDTVKRINALNFNSVMVESYSNFSVSRGFGSSAAFSVALVRALQNYLGIELDLSETCLAIEKIYHGKPSGIDTSVIIREKPIKFVGGAVESELKNECVDFVVADSGDREGCAQLIKKVQDLKLKNADQWSSFVQVMQTLVQQCEQALSKASDHSVQDLSQAVDQSHRILSELNLSTPKIDRMIAEAKSEGALAGKVSGAGGGGAVVFLVEAKKGQSLLEKLRNNGYQAALSRASSGEFHG